MQSNGVIAIDRLEATKKSLTRALSYVDSELGRRYSTETLLSGYLSRTLDLQTQAAKLEDEIRNALL
jgi:hypothetical protein